MKKEIRNGAVITLIAVVGLVILAVYWGRQREMPIEEAPPAAVDEVVSPVEETRERTEEARALVAKILEPRKVPEMVALSALKIERPVAAEGVETRGVETAEVETGAGIKLGAESVLAVVNGVPLTGAHLMPPGRFKKRGEVVLSPDVLDEVLGRSINRELIIQQAIVQGVALDERNLKALGDTYLHLTSSPLNVQGGGEVTDLNVRGDEGDALFYVRDRAARLLQLELLEQAGKADTASNRLAFSEELRSSATIETVNTQPPGDGTTGSE